MSKWKEFWRIRCDTCNTDERPLFYNKGPDFEVVCQDCMPARMMKEDEEDDLES